MKRFLYFFSAFLLVNSSCAQSVTNGKTEQIKSLIKEAFSAKPTMANDIHSLLIYENKTDLYTEYFNGFTADSLNNLKSITKSIVGLLTGIALEQGHIKSLHQPMIDFFEECELEETVWVEKKNITIENLLLMQAGIAWNNRALIKDDWWFNENPHCFLLS
ncbi:MAG: hypothetical protein AAFO07_26415, partial [Bacteroidota bacterium]